MMERGRDELPGPWFHHALRVRYQETDQMGVVYHANYLNWFEIGRTELIRAVGYPYSRIEEAGLMLPVVRAEVDFKRPARYDDVISVYTRVGDFTGVRLDMVCEVRKQAALFLQDIVPFEEDGQTPTGELLVAGMTRHVWVNRDFRAVRLEHELPELYALISKTN